MSHNKNKLLIELAGSAVENYIKERKIILPPGNLPKEFLTKKSGVFVTIEKEGKLRGCIGTYLATKENIAEEIISNAIAAAVEDYRFGPVQKEELPELSYTIYILNKPEIVRDIQDLAKFSEEELRQAGLNPKKYGIIVKSGQKSGLLLPGLEGIDTAKQQISIAWQKAGIDQTKEKTTIYKFTAKKYN